MASTIANEIEPLLGYRIPRQEFIDIMASIGAKKNKYGAILLRGHISSFLSTQDYVIVAYDTQYRRHDSIYRESWASVLDVIGDTFSDDYELITLIF